MAERRFPVLVGGAGDEKIALIGRDLVHPLPTHDQHAVRVARGHRFRALPEGRSAGGAARLHPDVAQRIEAEPIMDDRFPQQLIAEMIGKMAVIAAMDIALQFGRRDVEQSGRHREGINAQFLGAFVREGPVELRLAGRHQVHGSLHSGDFQLLLAECDHACVSFVCSFSISNIE